MTRATPPLEPTPSSAPATALPPAQPACWKRLLKWFLLGAGILFVLLLILVLVMYWRTPDRNTRDTISQVMTAEFGPYSEELEGWTQVDDQARSYVMNVQTQQQVTINGKRKLMLGILGYARGDTGQEGRLQYRFLVVDLEGKQQVAPQYFGMTSHLDRGFPIEVELTEIEPGKDIHGWQLQYQVDAEGEISVDREIYLIDFAKSEVVASGTLPVRYDTTSICGQPPTPVADDASSEAASATSASSASSVVSDASAENESEPYEVPCWNRTARYEPTADRGAVISPWRVTATSRNGEHEEVIVGAVVFDPRTLKLKLSPKVQFLFEEPLNE
ncbi:hypothetical protein [Chitinolyticbacter albus]|uniref:hypothetical protein n=1 Tax=Chitinolyticbacter albus TaxID=2961951 RepID=UPI00210C5CCB|nr:hypothetical protein [Chitinolyticbacter albus]